MSATAGNAIVGFICPLCGSAELSYWMPADSLFCRGCRTHWMKSDITGMTGPLWMTKDGRAMPISDMETQHIRHSIAKIWREGGKWRGRYMAPLLQELERRIKDTG